jgi:3-oxoacyl-[acyl-carrier protein] reductase
MRVDVSAPEEVVRMVDEVLARWNAIDVLVNNAGGSHPIASSGAMSSALPAGHSPDRVTRSFPPIVEITAEQWAEVMALNLMSVFLCCRAVTKHMMQRRKGRIINIASSGAVHPDQTILPTSPTQPLKGCHYFTKHLATELGPYGITVNSIAPAQR